MMRNLLIAALLLMTVATAATTTPAAITTYYTLDDVYSITVMTNEDLNNRMTALENKMADDSRETRELLQLQIAEFDKKVEHMHLSDRDYLQERTNPLRLNLINIMFFVTCILFLMKRFADDQLAALGHTRPKPQKKNNWLSKRLTKATPSFHEVK